jgi:hypothetical protein
MTILFEVEDFRRFEVEDFTRKIDKVTGSQDDGFVWELRNLPKLEFGLLVGDPCDGAQARRQRNGALPARCIERRRLSLFCFGNS